MIKRTLTICAALAACTAGVSLVQAQQAYPVPPGAVYSAAPPAYPDYRRGASEPDFDALEDDEAPNTTALPTPGPVMSPDDPRYGRPMIRVMAAPPDRRRSIPTAMRRQVPFSRPTIPVMAARQGRPR